MRRHEVNLVALTSGLIFTLIAIAGLANATFDVRWIWPALLAVLGVVGLAAAVRASRPRVLPDDDGPAAADGAYAHTS